MKTKAQIKAQATAIKNETSTGANTADRVGTAIYDVADNFVHEDDMPDMSSYQTTTAAATESTRLENLINAKASQTDLNTLSATVATKAPSSLTTPWANRFDGKIPYIKDTIDVTYNDAQTYFAELSTPNSITVNEDFSQQTYNIAYFYIEAKATMTVHLTNKVLSLTKDYFYYLVIMRDENNNIREFLFEGL